MAAPHVTLLFTLVDKMQINESNASDLLSQIPFHDQQLNDSFIEMVENIHMKQRNTATFSVNAKETTQAQTNSSFLDLAI